WENSSEESSSALLGMQPTLRQVPPRISYFSTQATFMPSCAARIAAVYPPGPDPMTTRSKVPLMGRLDGQQTALGAFQALLDAHQERHRLLAIHDAVIVGEREVHHRANHDLIVHHHRTLLDLVHAEDAALRRIQDRRRQEAPEHAAIRHGERAARQLVDRQAV